MWELISAAKQFQRTLIKSQLELQQMRDLNKINFSETNQFIDSRIVPKDPDQVKLYWREQEIGLDVNQEPQQIRRAVQCQFGRKLSEVGWLKIAEQLNLQIAPKEEEGSVYMELFPERLVEPLEIADKYVEFGVPLADTNMNSIAEASPDKPIIKKKLFVKIKQAPPSGKSASKENRALQTENSGTYLNRYKKKKGLSANN